MHMVRELPLTNYPEQDMFVGSINGYYEANGSFVEIDGYWLEGDNPARYAVDAEESVWVTFDENGNAIEYVEEY